MFYYNEALNIISCLDPGSLSEIEIRHFICDYYISESLFDKAINEFRLIETIFTGDTLPDFLLMTGINIYIIEKNYNKLAEFANRLLQSPSLFSKKYAYETLANLAKFKEDKDEAFNYVMKFKECFDSIEKNISRNAMIHQNSFYNYSLREKENISLREYKNRTKYIYVLSLLALIIIILGVAYFVTYKRKTKLAIHLKEEKIKKIESDLQKIENLQTSEKIETIKIGNSIRTEYLKLIEIKTPYKISIPEELIASNIYDKFKISAQRDNLRIDTEDWAELEKLVLTFYPKFRTTLVMLHSSISDYEYHVSLLTKCHFSNKEISKLTHHSPSSITNTRCRLFEKIFSKKGTAADMDYLIGLL